MTKIPTDFTAPMGRFEDWNLTRPVILHMLRQLAEGHYRDSLEGTGQLGGLAAMHGFDIAAIATEQRSDETAAILHQIGWLATVLNPDTDEEQAALSAIIAAADPWMKDTQRG